ncbi:RidA family protein [Qingshengfaniella alkalisoli]|uniref:RidA family protein n=1 Tax=Qingshengfaniella alkalisoli TaxID=2599296 RepID=A0A5B8J3N9_9RHOB|nr:RidA family protein [Qingshengfaniella alkalisoli]QDY71691.1 RidA family protein [Qingshengfaniella alkalisoli]
MKIRKLNPWTYPEGMDQGLMISDFNRLVFVSGQCAVGPDGASLHPANMAAQVQAALDNVETVLIEAGLSLANIVRMNTYVTDMDAFLEQAAEPMGQRLARYDVSPPGILAGITELGRKDLLVEIEAFAAA